MVEQCSGPRGLRAKNDDDKTHSSFYPSATRSVNEDDLWLIRQSPVCFIPFVDKCVGVHVKLRFLNSECHIRVLLRLGFCKEFFVNSSFNITFTFTV